MARQNKKPRSSLTHEQQQKLLEIRHIWGLYPLAKRLGVSSYVILSACTGGKIQMTAKERIESALPTMNIDDFKRFVGLAA